VISCVKNVTKTFQQWVQNALNFKLATFFNSLDRNAKSKL